MIEILPYLRRERLARRPGLRYHIFEYTEFNTPYNVTLNTRAMSGEPDSGEPAMPGDPIDPRTAFLYSQFIKGTLKRLQLQCLPRPPPLTRASRGGRVRMAVGARPTATAGFTIHAMSARTTSMGWRSKTWQGTTTLPGGQVDGIRF